MSWDNKSCADIDKQGLKTLFRSKAIKDDIKKLQAGILRGNIYLPSRDNQCLMA
jgi:hypothetical protein